MGSTSVRTAVLNDNLEDKHGAGFALALVRGRADYDPVGGESQQDLMEYGKMPLHLPSGSTETSSWRNQPFKCVNVEAGFERFVAAT